MEISDGKIIFIRFSFEITKLVYIHKDAVSVLAL